MYLSLGRWKRNIISWGPVAHVCNPSSPGGRGQENLALRPAQANSLRDPISKIPITKKACGVAQGVSPEFKSQYWKKKKKEYNIIFPFY
jgi:hypothetical protein